MLFTNSEEQEHIVAFMRSHSVAVLSTADKNAVPHAAVVYVYFDEYTKDFFFTTRKGTTKYDNLTQNPNAALALYEASSQTTVQTKGAVTEVSDEKRVEQVFRHIVQASRLSQGDNAPPVTQLYAGGYVTFKLSPSALHMATYSRHDPGTAETIIKQR